MVTTILFVCVFSLAVLYAIIGSVAAIRLSNHIGYSDGFLKLWNVTQLTVISFGKLDYSVEDAKAQELFVSLKKVILYFYSIFIPLAIVTFVVHFLGV